MISQGILKSTKELKMLRKFEDMKNSQNILLKKLGNKILHIIQFLFLEGNYIL